MDLQKSDAKILLRFMIAMASADQKLHAEEIGVIATVFEKIAGHPLNEKLLQDIFEANRKEQFSVFDDVPSADEFSSEFKRLIVKACYLVKIADRQIAETELDMMATIAARLNISGIE